MKSLIISRRRMLHNRLTQLGFGKFSLLLLFVLFLLGSISWMITTLFSHIAFEPLFTPDFKLFISEKILQMVFMAAYIMTIISALVSTVNILYLSKDLPMLISSPLPLHRLMNWKCIEVAVSSSLMAILLSLPVLIGYSRYFASTPVQILSICIGILLLFGSAVLIGMLIGLILPAIVSIRTLQPLLSVVSVIFIAAAVVGLRLLRPEKLFAPDSIDNLVAFMSRFDMGPTDTLPSAWLSGAVLHISHSNWPAAFLELGKLLTLSFMGWFFFHSLNRRYFLSTFEKLWQGKDRRYEQRERIRFRSPSRALLYKEKAMFFRSTEQWSQLLVILAILAVFVLNMQSLPINQPYLKQVLTFFTYAMGAFIIAGLNVRFTFTSLPMDFPGLVHVLCSPLNRPLIFAQKFLLHLIFHTMSALFIFTATLFVLRPTPFMSLVGGLFLFTSVPLFTIWAMGSGIGLCRESSASPQHLIISRQGIFYMTATFFHTLLMSIFYSRPLFLYYHSLFIRIPTPVAEITVWLFVGGSINLLLALILFRSYRKRWFNLEF